MHVTYPEGNHCQDKAPVFSVRSAHRAQVGKLHWPQQICQRITEVPHLLDPVTWVTEVNCLSQARKHNVLSTVKTTPRRRYFRQINYTWHCTWFGGKKYVTHPLKKVFASFLKHRCYRQMEKIHPRWGLSGSWLPSRHTMPYCIWEEKQW